MDGAKITDGRQIRAARAALGWTVEELASAAGLHRNTVTRTEARQGIAHFSYAADRIGEALAKAGVIMTAGEEGPGIAFAGNSRRMSRRQLAA